MTYLNHALEGEDSPGKGFSFGDICLRKWGLEVFGASVLK